MNICISFINLCWQRSQIIFTSANGLDIKQVAIHDILPAADLKILPEDLFIWSRQ
jgi:hypothetical protein